MDTLKGSCLCGAVTFTLKNSFQHFQLCHCIQCQKTTGTAHASNLFCDPDAITWLTGQESIARYDVPGRRISNAFCRCCGSRLPFLSMSGETLVVPAGVVEGEPDIAAEAIIFWPERASWYEAAIASPRYDTYAD